MSVGVASTHGVAGPDHWMAGWIAAECGGEGKPPVWLLPKAQDEWAEGWAAFHEGKRGRNAP